MLQSFQLILWRFRFKLIIVAIVVVTLIGGTDLTPQLCPGNTVSTLRQQAQYYEISIMFYYTSWNEESVEIRKLIYDISKYYNDYNIFVAMVDCWHLECNCTQTYDVTGFNSGSPHKWPTLILYLGVNNHIQLEYRGEWEFASLCEYINNALKPLDYIHDVEDLQHVKNESDAIVLGIFKNANYAYKQFTLAALQWLETDPLKSCRFIVSFNKTIIEELRQPQKVTLIPFLCFISEISTSPNHVKFFNNNDKNKLTYNSSNIRKWLQHELKRSENTYGYSTPLSLLTKLQSGPVLSILPNNDFYEAMKTIICKIRNNNCIHQYKKMTMKHLQEELNVLIKKRQNQNYCTTLNDSINPVLYLKYYYKICELFQKYFLQLAKPGTKDENFELYSPNITLQKLQQRIQCLERDMYFRKPSFRIAMGQYFQNHVNHWQQLHKSNRTMSITIIDRCKYQDFFISLGFNEAIYGSDVNTTIILLVDEIKESIYYVTTEQSKNGCNRILNILEEFLGNFFHNQLVAYKKVENLWYPKKSDSNNFSLNTKETLSLSPFMSKPATSYYIKRLNSLLFANLIYHQHNVTNVVLLYAPLCTLCANLQNSFLQLAIMLRHQEHKIRFFRLNIQANDMQWQFVMPNCPTLLVFTANGTGDSRIFPNCLQPNIQNVLAFILAQMPDLDRVTLIVAICESDALMDLSRDACWHFINRTIMQHISQYLHRWHLYHDERGAILDRLSAFKDLSLNIQHNLRLL